MDERPPSQEGAVCGMTILALGNRRFDVTHRALVVGILNRTTDSFYDKGAYFERDAFLRQAESLVAGGADLLEVGARKGGVGGTDVPEAEETDRACESLELLRSRFDLPLGVDTWRSGVAERALESGAVLANDMSGFTDPA